MDDYVAKPIRPEVLGDVLARWLSASAGEEAGPADEKPHRDEAEPAVFDRAELLDRLGGDEEIAGVVVGVFLDDAPRQIEDLRASVAAHDAHTSRRLAHGIKGAAANVGAGALREVAAAVEQASDAGDLATVETGMDALQREFERLRGRLEDDPARRRTRRRIAVGPPGVSCAGRRGRL